MRLSLESRIAHGALTESDILPLKYNTTSKPHNSNEIETNRAGFPIFFNERHEHYNTGDEPIIRRAKFKVSLRAMHTFSDISTLAFDCLWFSFQNLT